ncbi:MAG TPA: hypothetical protein VMG98_11805 [Verrucomicrobiae bacterium]|nr:hypothetical protein [Verrucomicrobiae bacterium]
MAPLGNPGTFVNCMHIKFLAALAALALFTPLAAAAQDAPSYAQPAPQQVPGDEQIQGRISSFDGGYNLTVQDDRGFVDNVQLHDGTIINPTGLTLAPGMVVSILGYNAGPYFAANEVDTPYTFAYGVPYYAGHPWNYYGPSISLGFFFGNTGWWHGGYFGPGRYHYVGNARVYDNVRVNNVYRGGTYRGRAYVAPPSRGGYYPHGSSHRDGRPPRF